MRVSSDGAAEAKVHTPKSRAYDFISTTSIRNFRNKTYSTLTMVKVNKVRYFYMPAALTESGTESDGEESGEDLIVHDRSAFY